MTNSQVLILLLLILLDKSSNRLKMKNVKMLSQLTLFAMNSNHSSDSCSIRLVNNLPMHHKKPCPPALQSNAPSHPPPPFHSNHSPPRRKSAPYPNAPSKPKWGACAWSMVVKSSIDFVMRRIVVMWRRRVGIVSVISTFWSRVLVQVVKGVTRRGGWVKLQLWKVVESSWNGSDC